MVSYELGKHRYVCPAFKYIPCRVYVCLIIIEIFLLVAGVYVLGRRARKKVVIRWPSQPLKEQL